MMCKSRNREWKPGFPYLGLNLRKKCQKKAQGGLGTVQDKLAFVPCQKVARQPFSLSHKQQILPLEIHEVPSLILVKINKKTMGICALS